MSTLSIICAGVAFTIIAISIFSTLSILSQVSEYDTRINELRKKHNKDNE